MASLTVAVTLQDLEKAIQNKEAGAHVCRGCLLAVALSRELGRTIEAGWNSAWTPDRAVEYPLPDSARDLIDLFDNECFDELRARLQHPQVFAFEVRE